jgi:hypothetical protein
MSRVFVLRVGALAIALAASAALANDSTAVTAAGGLVLTRTDDIDMVSEDLFVSVAQVRVHYVFRNRSAADIRTEVAFPMPDRDLSLLVDGDVGYPSEFHTRVGGQPVTATLERHVVRNGHDYTAMLEGLHIPLAPDANGTEVIIAALNRLPAARRAELARLGLVRNDEYDEGRGPEVNVTPLWTVRDIWHWEQVFPAGRDLVIDHEYVPGAGSSAGTPLAYPDLRTGEAGRADTARYCVDAPFIAALDRMRRAAGGDEAELPDYRVSYILTTGANWRSPIGSFRLVVDKGDPRNLVSFCGEGVRRISPTRFEVRHENWRPTRDLDVLIVTPGDG